MTRARRRKARSHTADAEWLRRRDYVISSHAADALVECREFWQNEPDVPADLREDPLSWRHLLAPEQLRSEIVERREALLAARRAWLAEHGDR